MIDRIRATYHAVSSAVAYSWAPLTVALFAVGVIFSGGAGAAR